MSVLSAKDEGIDRDARGHDQIWFEVSGRDDGVGFGHDVVGGHGHPGVSCTARW